MSGSPLHEFGKTIECHLFGQNVVEFDQPSSGLACCMVLSQTLLRAACLHDLRMRRLSLPQMTMIFRIHLHFFDFSNALQYPSHFCYHIHHLLTRSPYGMEGDSQERRLNDLYAFQIVDFPSLSA
jgi:hypothetical protein